jgi:hypothetical protein
VTGAFSNRSLPITGLGSNGESRRIVKSQQEGQGLFCIIVTAIYVVQNRFGSSNLNGILVTSLYQIDLIVATSHRITKYGQEP